MAEPYLNLRCNDKIMCAIFMFCIRKGCFVVDIYLTSYNFTNQLQFSAKSTLKVFADALLSLHLTVMR